MKKIAFTTCILIGALMCMGAAGYLVQGEFRYWGTWQDEWKPCGSGASPGEWTAISASPSVSQRTSAYFESTGQLFKIPAYWNYIEFRCSSKSTSSPNTQFEIWLFANSDTNAMRGGTLNFQSGSQVNQAQSGYYFCGGVSATEFVLKGGTVATSQDDVATYRVDRRWINKIGIVNTVQDADCFLEIIGY